MIDKINQRIKQTTDIMNSFSDDLKNNITIVAELISQAHKNKKRVFVIGNGGSACDAQHFEAELVGRFLREREPMSVFALVTNSPLMTAIGNDYSINEIFVRQVKAHVEEGDVLVAISTSGNSGNIINAVEEAKNRGAIVIGLTGESGGKMKDMYDVLLNVPSTHTPRIQESHILIIHLICEFVEETLN